MNVAILMPLARQLGGAETTFKQLLGHSQDIDINWHVIFFRDGPLVNEVQRDGVSTYVVNTGRLRQPLRFAKAVRRIAELLQATECQLVLSWSAKPHIYGSLAALLARIPSAWYQLGSPRGVHLSFIDRFATLLPAQLVLTLSEMGKSAQESLWPKRRTKLVYPGVDLDHFESAALPKRDDARIQLGLAHHGPIIGIVGRLQRWKGMHVLVRAMPLVLEQYPDVLCLIVGGRHELEPDYEAHLECLIKELGIQQSVQLLGFQTNIPLWMQAMDVVVHASDHEPFGLVVIEAMALGKPVVAANSGGPREIINEGVDGLLSPFGDSKSLAGALISLLADKDFADRIGRQAEIRAQQFSIQAYVREMSKAIYELHDNAAAPL